MVGLATCYHLPNFGIQGEKGGDFLSGFLKKYYPNLVWRKAFLDKKKNKLQGQKQGQNQSL
jgi:hypothetical protein